MKIHTCTVPSDYMPTPRLEKEAMDKVHWVEFGDEKFLFADQVSWQELSFETESNIRLTKPASQITEQENLHLIFQKGRLFQQEHPDVPILYDKGRYLVADISPDQIKDLRDNNKPCFKVQALHGNQVIFRQPNQETARQTPSPWIQALVDHVSQTNIKSLLSHLTTFHTRHSVSSDYHHAATWARDQLTQMGYGTQLHQVTVGNSNSYNVIADRSGNQDTPLLIVVAHLDSVNHQGNVSSRSPGADDNGSGTAGLLEIARVLENSQTNIDLRFILFGGEEQGLLGSKQFLASLDSSERERIQAVINMDMIGTQNTISPTVLIEGATLSESMINALTASASTYTNLQTQTSLNAFGSDHVPFIEQGIPAVLTIEGADGANDKVHTAEDNLDHINYDLIQEIIKMNIAYLASLMGQDSEN